MSQRQWTVEFEGEELTLTPDEYVELKLAAQDDSARAQALALAHLARKREH